jgi:N-acetylglutamate synthase-like GNAT family acetyltransferase
LRTEPRTSAVRAARAQDAPRVRELMEQLGYRVSVDQIAERIGMTSNQFTLLVAQDEHQEVVGWVAIALYVRFVGGMRGEIEGFIVDERARGGGVGGELLAAAHAWARERGCTSVRVLSNVVRERAHRFYERHGYRKLKAQFALEKDLSQ